MKLAVVTPSNFLDSFIKSKYLLFFSLLILGLIGCLGFAPFNMPGCTIASIALLYLANTQSITKNKAFVGFIYGLGFFGSGVSWVLVSIHDYGNLNYIFALLATISFIIYLSLYPALVCYLFSKLSSKENTLYNGVLFSVLWCLSEFLRSSVMTGFPWLLIGTSQIDTTLKSLFPITGIYGVTLCCVFSCTLLAAALQNRTILRHYYLIGFILLLTLPSLLSSINWTHTDKKPISVGVIQANLAMRDKWDDSLFWNLLTFYEKNINELLGADLIVLPESAIPLPATYIHQYLNDLSDKAKESNSAILLGILQPNDDNETQFFNALISLGNAKGTYFKQHLVPFGEYIPAPFMAITKWLNIPDSNISVGKSRDPVIRIANHPIASLICYELAYPHLLRTQMPIAQLIVSISDNGWFGRSLASYQQVQMARTLSLITGRYQILANNDGLSSIINQEGDVVTSLPPFSSGVLHGEVFSSTGSTPWILLGDKPTLLLCVILLILLIFLRVKVFHYH